MTTYYEDLKQTLQENPDNAEKVLDQVFQRKEHWKEKAKALFRSNTKLRKVVDNLNTTISQLESEITKEREMKNWWKYVSFSTALACAVICFTFIIHAITANSSPTVPMVRGPVEPMSGQQQVAPRSVLSSIKILVGDKTGSGTVIAKGEEFGTLLTCAHVFAGSEIGQTFWVYFPDGTYTKGTLTAKSDKTDLAIATIPADTVLATTAVPPEMPKGDIKLVGYTGGEGPMYRAVTYQDQSEGMWRMNLANSSAEKGDSGGGVFQQNQLIGVATAKSGWVYYKCNCRWYKRRDDSIYVVPHQDVVAFLKESIPQESIASMGDYSDQMEVELYAGRTTESGDTPPLWSPRPNIPLHLPTQRQLEQRVQLLEKRIMAQQDEAPKPDGLQRPSEVPNPKEGVKPNYDKSSKREDKPKENTIAAPKKEMESVWQGEPAGNLS